MQGKKKTKHFLKSLTQLILRKAEKEHYTYTVKNFT
jgi:hypothetical protein